MKYRKIWIGSGLVLLIAVMITVYVIRNTQAQAEVKTVKPTREEINEEIVTSGVLEAGGKQEVYLDPERGQLSEIPVKPGKKVKKGTTLVRDCNDLLDSERQQAEMQIEAARVKRSGTPAAAERGEKGRSIHPGRPRRRSDVRRTDPAGDPPGRIGVETGPEAVGNGFETVGAAEREKLLCPERWSR